MFKIYFKPEKQRVVRGQIHQICCNNKGATGINVKFYSFYTDLFK